MPIYTFKGITSAGKDIKDSVTAESVAQAKAKVRQMGVMLTSIAESKVKKSNSSFSLTAPKVKIEDLALMTRQLATLIKARIQIVEALSALIDQVENDTLRLALSEIKQKVNEGSSLANAFSDYPKIFNSVYVNMVEAGEASGTLDIVLLRLADFTESQMKLKSKISGALMYPIIISVVGFAMMNIIFIFVIPKITKIFVSMKKELPLQTKICIWISDALKNHWLLMLIAIAVGIYIFNKWKNSAKGKEKWHKFALKAPILSKLVVMIDVSRFCSTLATLLNSGVPIIASMRIVKNLITNVHIQRAVDKSKENVSEGKSMTGPLIDSTYFPPMVTHMIGLGERSGELEPMLQIVSENYEDQIDAQLGRITALLQPIMMVLLGGVVFFIVMSVIVPIMDLNTIRK